jgi:hypothetical protein
MKMKYVGYALSIIIAVAGIISGLVAGPSGWLIFGLAAGFLIVSIWLIIRGESSTVEGSDDVIWAMFQVPIGIGLICLAIMAAAVALTSVIYRFVLNLPI